MDQQLQQEIRNLANKTVDDYHKVIKVFMNSVPVDADLSNISQDLLSKMSDAAEYAIKALDGDIIIGALRFSEEAGRLSPLIDFLLRLEFDRRMGEDPKFIEIIFAELTNSLERKARKAKSHKEETEFDATQS